MDLKAITASINPQTYKFCIVPQNIELILPPAPKDINISVIVSKKDYFLQFIQQVNEWLRWFDKFLIVCFHIIEWLKNWNVEGASQLSNDMRAYRTSKTITVTEMKSIIERTFKLLRPFNDIQRLCHLLNCSTSFQLIDAGGQNNNIKSESFINDLKKSQPTNSFKAEPQMIYTNILPINDRQNVQWSIACEKYHCNVQIKYQIGSSTDGAEVLFEKDTVSIDKHILQGEFETQRGGELMITMNNSQFHAPRMIWYRIKQTPLSMSYLFHGIFNMFYQRFYRQSMQIIKEREFSRIIDEVFSFIDNLLKGTVSLKDMADLKALFCDRNIRVKEEVRKLFMSRTSNEAAAHRRSTTVIGNDKDIDQVCEWLQIYQYYSHLNIILNCIETFDILQADSDNQLIVRLKRLRDENCSLKEITQAYDILKRQFQNLSGPHLQLIKVALECSNAVQMMKKSDLYSPHGRRRFQELRDNLTTQFQLQERNNMILNSWIIAYALCEPFVLKARNFEEFVNRIAGLSNFEENSLNHLKSKLISSHPQIFHCYHFIVVVNDNVQIINMWLSAEETSVLDNALITMEHLYKTGEVKIYLRHLMNEKSYFEIMYSIDKIETDRLVRTNSEDNDEEQYNPEAEHDQRRSKKIKFTLSMSDIEDHKRQLTFCNVDLQENMASRKILLNEQLKLLKIIENIYSILDKLETTGHPDYQLREDQYEIHDRTGKIKVFLKTN